MDKVDAGAVWDLLPTHDGRRKAYLFFGKQYTRFDVESGTEDFGYPKNTGAEWDGLWGDRIDAVIVWPVKVKGRRKAYFFRGGEYMRWDVLGNHPDYTKPLDTDSWKDWPSGWDHVDAAVHFPGDSSGCNSNDGIVYFFSGSEYCRFNVSQDTFFGDPIPIAKEWPGLPAGGIDAAVGWPVGRTWTGSVVEEPDKAYFFWGTKYLRYDLHRETLDAGYPKTIVKEWPAREVCVWAAGDVPATVDDDARLREADGTTLSTLEWPAGSVKGQAGWHVGLNFATFAGLLKQLQQLELPDFLGKSRLQSGEIDRLAICAHGNPGDVRINGRHSETAALTPAALKDGSAMHTDVMSLEKWLAPDATVLFMGCLAGSGDPGVALLKRLSTLWPGRTVVMYWSLGYQAPVRMLRKGTKRCEPGMRNTRQLNTSVTVEGTKAFYDFEAEMLKIWDDLAYIPWASHDSLTARSARNGVMLFDSVPAKQR